MSKQNIIVLYHASCPDGFTAAWVAWRVFGARARYIPVRHQIPPPRGLEGKEVYIFDFSYPRDVMKTICTQAKRVVALDHHITARASTHMAHDYRYNLNHSGAVLAWNYFFPKQKIPRMVRHIEDIDIWKFTIPGTREISAVLGLYDFDFRVWSKLARDIENPEKRKTYIANGRLIMRYEDHLVHKIIGRSHTTTIAGKKCAIVNSPVLESKIGKALVDHRASIGAIWYYDGNGFKFSLRSKKADVAKLAKRFGGGGQKHASGFYIKKSLSLPK